MVWSTLSIALNSIFEAFCVSWNDRMHTTSFPAAVLNLSLICPFVSVSPATFTNYPITQNPLIKTIKRGILMRFNNLGSQFHHYEKPNSSEAIPTIVDNQMSGFDKV